MNTLINNSFKILYLFAFATFFIACEDDDNGSNGGLGNVNNFNYSLGPGDNAQDYVSNIKFDGLTLEILHQANVKPSATAINNLSDFLNQFLDKNAINIVFTELPDSNYGTLSIAQIREIEKNNRKVFNNNSTISACMLFVDADFSGNTENGSVLGVAYNNTSMCIFGQTIRNNSGGVFQPSISTVESTVMQHEFGHIMGLVNNGAPLTADHHDSENGAHCNVESCLMYFAVEGSNFVDNFMGGNIPELDNQCQADLEALK